MAEVDVFETSRVVLRCTVVRGQAKSNKATFKVMRGGTAFLTKEVNLVGDKAYLEIEKLDEVKADEKNWELTYSVTCDGEAQDSTEVYRVWPLKLKLKAVDDKGKAFKGVQWLIKQAGGGGLATVGWDESFARSRPDGTVVHFFKRAGEFSVDVVGAHRRIKWNKEAFRDLEAEVDDRVDPKIESPPQPAEKKQYVNLVTASDGADANGHEIVFEVSALTAGVKGGKVGNSIFVEVVFGRESKRNSPEPKIVDGLDAENIRKVTPDGKKYTCVLKLKADAGSVKFKIDLGLAGGDTCTVKFGGTPDCDSSEKREFVNWRRVYYDLLAPDFMTLETVDGKKDLPAAARNKMKGWADEAFFEYVLQDSFTFTEDEAPAGSIVPGSYCRLGIPKAYLLTGWGFRQYPKAFDKTHPRTIFLKLAHAAYNYIPSQKAPVDLRFSATSATQDFDIWSIDANTYYTEKAAHDNTDAVLVRNWKAKIANPNSYLVHPTLEWETPGACNPNGAVEGQLTVREMLQGGDLVLNFPRVGIMRHFREDLEAGEAAKIDSYVAGFLDRAALHANGKKVRFDIIGTTGNSRRDNRYAAVKQALQTSFDNQKPTLSTHKGVLDDGTLRQGVLPRAAIKGKDYRTLTVTLPTGTPADPGPADLVNATVTATKCPITLTFQVVLGYSRLGTSGQAGTAQAGENLVLFEEDDPTARSGTMLHELSHSYGAVFRAGGKAVPPGMALPPSIPAGDQYTGHGHNGSHCAAGLSGAEKGGPSFGGKNGTCLMFGEGHPGRAGFCPSCRELAKGSDLLSLG